MMFLKRIRRSLALLQERKAKQPDDGSFDPVALEKGDLSAMIVSALIVILPVALLVLLVITGIAALWIL